MDGGRFDEPDLLQQTLGDFWAEVYGDPLVDDYLRGTAFQERQLDQLAAELADSVDRHTCPLYHTRLWHPLNGGEPTAGAAVDPTAGTHWRTSTAEDGLAELHLIADGLAAPNALLVAGIDFVLETDGAITFASDPTADARMPTAADDAGPRLYGFRAGTDARYLARLFGAMIGFELASTADYRRALVAALDAVSGHPAEADVFDLLAALAGVPRCGGDGERVELVTTDAGGRLVATDAAVYRLPAAATPVVSVGNVLAAGDWLCDAVRTYRLTGGVVPPALSELTVDAGLLSPSLSGPLTFSSGPETLTVAENVDGYTKVTFPLGGDPGDVSAFFDEVHARGVAAGATLANWLDTRGVGAPGNPSAAQLPATVDPLALLTSCLLRYHLTVAVVKPASFAAGAPGFADLGVLRHVVPPHDGVLVVTV